MIGLIGIIALFAIFVITFSYMDERIHRERHGDNKEET